MANYAAIPYSSHAMMLLYIDPGAGSMVIQAALAALLAIPFIFRTQVARVVHKLRRGRDEDSDPETGTTD